MILIFHRAFQSFDQFRVIVLLYDWNRIRMYDLLEMMNYFFSRICILNPYPVNRLINLQITLMF